MEVILVLTINMYGRIDKIVKTFDNGTCIFEFSTAQSNVVRYKNGKVYCKYISERCFISLNVNLTGVWNGSFFIVTSLEPVYVDDDSVAKMISDNVPGVGIKTANKIVETYGKRLFKFSKRELDASLQVDFSSFSSSKIHHLCNLLSITDDGLKELETFLFSYDVNYEIITSIYSEFGKDSIRLLKKDPYSIGYKNGIRFRVCEKIALDLKIDFFADCRIKGLIYYVLNQYQNAGNTFMPIDLLCKKVNYYSLKYSYHSKIGYVLISNMVFSDPSLYCDKYGISFKYTVSDEEQAIEEIKILSSVPAKKETVSESDIDRIEHELRVTYGKSQRKTFYLMEKAGISLLIGGPGTGKTTTIKGLTTLYKEKYPHSNIALCAPTGRAAKRLSESTGMPASTIHKLVDFRPFMGKNSVSKDRSDPIDADFIIVDECSMVGIHLLCMLLQAVKPGAIVLLVGDDKQLPSVEPGNVLHDMIQSGVFKMCKLEENYRQNEKNTISLARTNIENGIVPEESKNVHLIQSATPDQSFEMLKKLFNCYYDKENPFLTQIIEPTYRGAAGVNAVNKFIRESLGMDPLAKVSKGDKIIFKKTDYDRGYFNGQLGIITDINEAKIRVNTDDNCLTLPYSAIADIEAAYSFTVHRSQGSEADLIIIYLPEEPKIMLQRNLLYTAVTRAKKEVFIIFEGDSLKIACENTSMVSRLTRFGNMLKETFLLCSEI